MKHILFLCTGNSCRSILAEAYINHAARGWRGFSAGSRPTGTVHPMALETLADAGIAVDNARSKSWDEFAAPQAPHMDAIVTVCDNAAGEACPVWPGHPVTHHWPFPDPAAFHGTPQETAAHFAHLFGDIRARLDLFLDA